MATIFNESTVAAEPTKTGTARQRLLTEQRVRGNPHPARPADACARRRGPPGGAGARARLVPDAAKARLMLAHGGKPINR